MTKLVHVAATNPATFQTKLDQAIATNRSS
jgi:hypothetical protein